MGAAGTDYGVGAAVDTEGHIFVGGYGDAGWGTPKNDHAGGHDVFVAKLDSDGTRLWHTFLGSAPADSGGRLVLDGAVNPFVSGTSNAFVARIGEPGHALCTSAPAEGGSFTPTSRLVADGETTTFDITAALGHAVDKVTGCGGDWTGSNPYTTGAVNGNCLVEATFKAVATHGVTATVDAHGALDATNRTVNDGTTASFTLTPTQGYVPDPTVGGDCPTGSWDGTTYTTGAIIADCDVLFSHQPGIIVSATVDGHGTVDD